jgi:Protein of unknown function (DUF3467)
MADDPKVTVVTQLPRARDPLYRELYSNSSVTMLGTFDITVLFQRQSELNPGQPVALDQVAVVFAPQHFKALVRSLNETLTAYEAVYGVLAIPDQDTAPRNNASDIEKVIRSAREAQSNPSSGEPTPPSTRPHGAAKDAAKDKEKRH